MLKKLTRHGNSLALVIDKGVLELLNIDDQTPLEISTDGTLLLISPVRDEKRKLQFQEALEKVNTKYGRALEEAGRLKEPIFFGLDEVIEIHHDQINRHGGPPGIRDIELLKSAISMPPATFGGEYLHKNLYEMAAAYLFHITRNHPFLDGNKRTGAVAAAVFLIMNGIEFQAEEDSYEKMVRSVAEGKTDKQRLLNFSGIIPKL